MKDEKSYVCKVRGNFTLDHWGTYSIEKNSSGKTTLHPLKDDSHPSSIGLDKLSIEVQKLRVRQPSFRESWLRFGFGSRNDLRGKDKFIEVSWDEAFELISKELIRIRSCYGNSSIFGGSYGWASAGRFHHAQSQIHRFLNTIGGYIKGKDSYSFGAGSVIMPHIVAPMEQLLEQHTDWSTLAENNQLFVAFGGIPLRNTQMTAGGPKDHRVSIALDKMRDKGINFLNISPSKQDIDGPSDWIPIRPGTDVALILSLLHVIISEDLYSPQFLEKYCIGSEEVELYILGKKDLQPKTPHWASQITGIPERDIIELAHRMATSKTMINASWSIQRQSHGEQTYWAIITLAAYLGQIGTPGGGFGIGYGTLNSVGSNELSMSGPRLPQGINKVNDFIPVARIADALLNPGAPYSYNGKIYHYPDIKLIYWAGGNPFHHHQNLNRLISAWRKPDTIIINEQFWTSSAKMADIVLPASTNLERDDIGYSSREGQIVAMRKAVEIVGEAKSDFEIFSGIAKNMGVGNQYTEGKNASQWLEFIYEEFRQRNNSLLSLPSFTEFFEIGLLKFKTKNKRIVMLEDFILDPEKNHLNTPSGKIELYSEKIAGFKYTDCPGQATWIEPIEWHNSIKSKLFPLHLISQEPSRKLHSQLDHSPYSRERKINGREPITLNIKDADMRGIINGSLVRVYNNRGSFLASAQVTKEIIEGVAIIATGAWFDPMEWTPENNLEKHGNPNAVTLDTPSSQLSQATSAQSCLVEVEIFTGTPPKVTAFDLPEIISHT